MPDVIQAAASGRAKCRSCGVVIAKGELRFGESSPNAYGEGETLHWLHLYCAAAMRPEKFLGALDASEESIADREELRETAAFGVAHRRLPRLLRAEKAPSGRAHCRSCREIIDKGSWRMALQLFEEGRFSPIGSIHVGCCQAYFGTTTILGRIRRLTPSLTPSDLAELEEALKTQREAPADPESESGSAESEPEPEADAAPGLVKTRPSPGLSPGALRTKTGE